VSRKANAHAHIRRRKMTFKHNLSYMRDGEQKKDIPPTYHLHCHDCGKDGQDMMFFVKTPCEKVKK
jgi:hypothetical protein